MVKFSGLWTITFGSKWLDLTGKFKMDGHWWSTIKIGRSAVVLWPRWTVLNWKSETAYSYRKFDLWPSTFRNKFPEWSIWPSIFDLASNLLKRPRTCVFTSKTVHFFLFGPSTFWLFVCRTVYFGGHYVEVERYFERTCHSSKIF